ncbi:protocadherin Fat 4-like isoform X2 [Physella acuta]|uniref:protocadherin Fat 4-like isoform X2 n=1 Tax=Physella acuta TaxID=109671 RepID=UPI0027DD08E1|nr:protocadherin Fat 4-like isoform X2 [Physella acuta]
MLVNRAWLLSARSVLLLTTLAASHLVGITSANDCTSLNSVIQVNETLQLTPIGTVILRFNASKFAINTAQDLFKAVQTSTGNWSIQVNKELDAEKIYAEQPQQKGLLTYSTSCANIGQEQTLIYDLMIMVVDVDEFVPSFPNTTYTISVPESTPVNTALFTFDVAGVRAVDLDANPATPEYRIVDGAQGFFLMIDILKGVVTLENLLDYESGITQFNLNISVKESNENTNAPKNYCVLQINVVDVDDMNPVFDQSSYRLQLNESMYSPTQYFPTVPPVSAHDGDLTINTNISFTVDTSSQNIYGSKFILSPTGYIAVNGSLEQGLYSINIKAFQQDNPISRFAVAVLTLSVTGVNKFKPEMTRSQYQLNVSELAPVGLILLTVAATDKDSGDNAVFEFVLDNNVDATFRITTDQGQGIITLLKPLDRETKASYSLQVYAQETKTAEKLKSNFSIISITVLDENDNSPNFTQQSYLFTINRTGAIGTPVGTINATDPDEGLNGQVLYSLQPSTDFSINSQSGQISLKKILSTSDVGTKYVTAIATDNSAIVQNRRSTVVEIAINVLPVNDQAPVFSTTYTFNISETTPPNTVIGQLKANDPDGDTVMYFIQSGNSDSFFQLGQSNGVLTLIKENDLDVDSPKLMFKLVVVASDGFHNTSTDVNVNFLYVNEFDPVIQPIQRVQLNETAAKNTIIVKVKATDKDRGADGVLTYSLVPASNFSINSATGEITLACDHCLDYNIKQSYDLFVLVEDGGNPHKFSFTTFTVAITEIILVSPKFSQKNYEVSLKENQKNNTTILQLKATDPDTPDNLLTYGQVYPIPAAALSCFVLPNGTVVCNTLDAEINDIIVFDVNVTDGSNIDTATITIHVLDVNDNSPNIDSIGPINLPENTPVDQLVYTVKATDLDRSNEGFTFFLVDGTDGKFIINRSTGAVTTAGVFDRSEKQTYNVDVWVSDHGTPPRYNSTTLVVNIVDSNTAPEFVDTQNNRTSEFVFEVNENLTIGSLIGSLHARDPDSGSSGRLSFSIQGGDPDKVFMLGSSDGNLVLAKSLNYESQQTYTLTAVVADQSVSALSATARVTVNVKNVIEAPQWPLPFPVVYLTQSTTCNFNVQAFSREVTTVASKGDEPVEYKLLNMTSYFTINKTSGLLRVTRPLNASQYSIALAACSGDVCSNAELTVVVRTDDILAFCPAFVNVWINESSPINYTVIDLNTNKGDIDLQYTITSDNDTNDFYIDAKNGTLFVRNKLDRETIEKYNLLIEAVKSSSQETATVQVIIRLTDVPDEAPTFLSTKFEGEIGEDAKPGDPVHLMGTSIDLTVSATDKDLHASLSYSISNENDTSAGSFSVNEFGVIALKKPIDYEGMAKELSGIYSFYVVVTDGIFNTSVRVVVHVLDANDNSPTFDDPGLLWLNVSEDSYPREIGRVSAKDRDSLDAGKLEYFLDILSPVSKGNPFSINTRTGQINLEDVLDRERVDEYSLRVTVVDSAQHNATKDIRVTVLDVNDQAPTFPLQNYYWNVTEGISGSSLNITAYDKDIGNNSVVEYSLTEDTNCSFTLIKDSSNNVYVQVVKSLDRELLLSNGVAQIQLKVEASDILHTSTCTIFVTVMDINDNPPVFSQSLFTGQVKENAKNATEIQLSPAITVSDDDGPEYGRETVRFKLADNSSFFSIDPITGKLFVRFLTVQDHLDRETNSVYNVMVIATDDYGKGFSANASIVVNITDVNDEKPVFKKSSYIFSVPEDAQIGYTVGKLDALDNDTSGGITLYSLVGSDMFAIDSITGVIKVTGRLEGKISSLTLNATATDFVNGFSYAVVIINITDVNDHCPEWDPASLTFSVSETGQAGDFIGQLNASDADFGANGAVSYYINNTAADLWLHISQTGNITLLKAPSGVAYDLNVYATDGGDLPCVTQAKLHINVIGVNRYPPEICYNDVCGVQSATFDFIPDKSKMGSVIGQISARDNDTGINGKVTFSLAGNGSDFINVSDLGFLTLKKNIDLKKMGNQVLPNNTLKVTILAIDGGTDHKTANATLVIRIMGAVVISFSNISYTFNVDENKNNTFVGRVEAKSDLSNQISYTIITKDVPFKIIGTNGTITTTSALDREVKESYVFIVSASDGQGSSKVLVIVEINDVNEFAPVFDDNSITVLVEENQIKPNLVSVHAHDDDATDNVVTYELLDSEAFPQFNVSEKTGSINLVRPLDAEKERNYTLHIMAKDAGTPERIATATVTVEVLDVNEYPPVFEKLFYEFNITKSDTIPQEVATVKATDNDTSNLAVFYTLIQDNNNDDSKSFSINILTGVITIVQTLDKKDVYSFQVKATDLDFGSPLQLASDVTVKINVLNRDIIPQLSVSPTTVTTFVGMVKGSKLNVIISTQDAIALNITDGDTKNVFKIVGEKIILQTQLTDVAVYTLTLTATSTSGSKATQQLTVTVRSVTFDQPFYLAKIPENSKFPQVICTVNSLAANLSVPVSYTLLNFNDKFKINQTGAISVEKSLDREEQALYLLDVTITPQLSSMNRRKRQANQQATNQTTVVVQVEDQNDNPPSFGNSGSVLSLEISANVNKSYLVTTLKAFDPDEGLNGVIFYRIVSSDRSDALTLNNATGDLTVASTDQLKSLPDINLNVSATDLNGSGLSAFLAVEIQVKSETIYKLKAAIPISTFTSNKDIILVNLSLILGFEVKLFNASKNNDGSLDIQLYAIDEKNATVPSDQIEKKVKDKQSEINTLFESFSKSSKSSSGGSDGDFSVSAIALIVLACVMFCISLGAILVAYLLWRKQRNYSEKEENAAKVRQKIDEQMGNIKTESLSSDPDEHLEMVEMSPENVDEQEVTLQFETEFKSSISTMALRRHLQDKEMQWRQQLFQAIGEEDEERQRTASPDSDGGPSGNDQAAAYVNDQVVARFNDQVAAYVNDQVLAPVLSHLNRDTGVIHEEAEENRDDGSSSSSSSVFVAGTDVTSPEGSKFNDLAGLYELVGKTGKDVQHRGGKPRGSSSSSDVSAGPTEIYKSPRNGSPTTNNSLNTDVYSLPLNLNSKIKPDTTSLIKPASQVNGGLGYVNVNFQHEDNEESEEEESTQF